MNQNNEEEPVKINLSSVYRINDDVKQCIINAMYYYLQLPIPENFKVLGNQALRSFGLPILSSESQIEHSPINDVILAANNKNTIELIKKIIDKGAEQMESNKDKNVLIIIKSQIEKLFG